MNEQFVVITMRDLVAGFPAITPPMSRKEAEIEVSWMMHHGEYVEGQWPDGGLHIVSLQRYEECRRD